MVRRLGQQRRTPGNGDGGRGSTADTLDGLDGPDLGPDLGFCFFIFSPINGGGHITASENVLLTKAQY